MINDLRRRVRVLTANLPHRVTLRAAVAFWVVGVVVLGGILQAWTPSTHGDSARPAEVARSEAKSKFRKGIERTAVADPISVAKPPVVDRLAIQLYAEYPELDPRTRAFRELDDWGKVIRLREFSYRHTAFANRRNHAAHRAGADMVEKVIDGQATLAEAYDFFDRAKGGVLCGEAAELLQRLYAWAGFEAFYIKIGFHPPTELGSNSIHALNLVRIKVAGPAGQARSILSVHDPSLNVSYGDSQGQPIDYFEILERLARRQAEQIHFVGEVPAPFRRSDPITVAFGRDIERSSPENFTRSWNVGLSPNWSATADGHWVFSGPRTIWAFERLGDTTWKPELFREGLPPETIYLHCFPILIRGTPKVPALLKHARQVLSGTSVAATDTADAAMQK